MLNTRLGCLGLAVAMGAAAGGCLLDYPETPDALRAPRNRPPRIEESNVQPQRLVTLDPAQPGGCRQEFVLPVSDPDTDDTLRVHWYVDFDRRARPGEPVSLGVVSVIPPSAVPGQEVRSTPATRTLDTAQTGSEVATPGLHLVEAFVTDGQLQVQLNAGDQELSITSLPDSSFVASYAWFVNTLPGCPLEGAP